MPDQRLTALTALAAFPADPADLLIYVVDLTEAVEDDQSKKAALTLIDTRFATAAQGALADTALQPAAIGVTVQAWDADLDTLAGLAKMDGNFIVGDGAAWTVESGATARASLGLGSLAVINSPLPIANGGSGQIAQQAAIDALTNVVAATNEHVLTKDTATGNAIFKASAGGSSLPVVDETAIVFETGVPANTLTFNVTPYTAARVVTWPDAALTVAGLEVANVFTIGQVIDGTVDEIQQRIQAVAGQTADIFVIESSAGTDLFKIDNIGKLSSAIVHADVGTTTNLLGVAATIAAGAVGITTQQRVLNFQATITGSAGGTNSVYGIRGLVTYDQTAGTLAGVRAVSAQVTHSGEGLVSLVNGLQVDLSLSSSGNVTNYNGLAINAPSFSSTGVITTQARGANIANQGNAAVATAFGLLIADQSGATVNNFAIQTNAGLVVINEGGDASTDFRIEGDTDANLLFTKASTDAVGIGINAPGAKLHIDQLSTTAAKPVLTVDQADVSEEFIRFIGTSANGVLTQSIVENADVGAATLQGWLKVFVQDDGNQLADQAYFVPIYTLA